MSGLSQKGLRFHGGVTFVHAVDRQRGFFLQGTDESLGSLSLPPCFTIHREGDPNNDTFDATLQGKRHHLIDILGEFGAGQMARGEDQGPGGVADRQADAALSQIQGEQLQLANSWRTRSATPRRASSNFSG